MKQIKFLVEEFHRGKWTPLMVEKKGKTAQRRVFITQEQADAMNVHQNDYKERYVRADKSVNEIKVNEPETVEAPKKDEVVEETLESVRAEYQKVFGKKAFNGWKIPVLKEKIKAHKEQ